MQEGFLDLPIAAVRIGHLGEPADGPSCTAATWLHAHLCHLNSIFTQYPLFSDTLRVSLCRPTLCAPAFFPSLSTSLLL